VAVSPSESLRGVATLTQVSRSSAPARLRKAMGRFATGVTIVTTAHRDHVHGMTANGVMSVSLDPPLIVVSLGESKMAEMLPRTRRYGVSVLGADQEALARHFAGRPVEEVAPKFTWWRELPFIDGALAHVGCRVEAIHQAGDHRLWIGRVEYMEYRDGAPLLFYAGRFLKLPVEER
jgi:flavin reductase (DIM6/NTAB) family NADH-FMN oxidoreductase RutF